MSDPSKARFASEVRSMRQRTEPLASASPATGVPFDKPRPRTTRFRLERVSLLPFVPGPLIAYVERTRVRRARLLAIAAVITAATFVVALWFVFASAPASAPTETPRRERAKRADEANARPPAEPGSLAAAPLPADSAESDTRESVPASSPPRAKRSANDDVDRSARPGPKGASSAWWW